jgi:hypothetical protein
LLPATNNQQPATSNQQPTTNFESGSKRQPGALRMSAPEALAFPGVHPNSRAIAGAERPQLE